MRGPRVWACIIALSVGCGPAYKPKVDAGYKLEATDFPFPSGLRVVFQRDDSQPSVLVSTVIDVGSSSDPVGKEGLAHFLEHLCFRTKAPGFELSVRDRLRRMGAGGFNASTSDDITSYYALGPKSALVPLLEIEAGRLVDPLAGVTEEVFAAEREIVRNELRMRTENTLAYRLYELSKSALFPEGHRYQRSGIGSHASLDAITLEDVKVFAAKHYIASNTTIVVAGDFAQAEIGSVLNKGFPRSLVAAPGSSDQKLTLRKPEPRVPETSPEPPPPVDTTLRRVEGPVQQDTLVLAWSLPGGYRENEPLIELTVVALNFALREKLGPQFGLRRKETVDSLSCGPIFGRDASVAVCTIRVAAGVPAEKVAKWALDGVDTLHQSFRGETYFFKDARQSEQARLFRQSGSLWRGRDIAEYAHFRGRADLFSGSMERWEKTRPKDSHDLASKYLTRGRAVQVLVSPYAGTSSTGTRERSSSWHAAEGNGDVSWITDAALKHVAVVPDPATWKSVVLENDLRVVIKRHAGAPFVRVALLLGGGRTSATPWGLSDFAFLHFEARDPARVAGAWLAADYGDAELIGVEAPSGNLDEALDLVSTRIRSTMWEWHPDALERVVYSRRRRLNDLAKSPARSGDRALWSSLYPKHPLGQRSHDLAAIERLSRGDIRAWYQGHFAPGNATLLIVGNVDLQEAQTKATGVWAGWRKRNPGERDAGFPAPSDPPEPRVLLVDEPDATQTSLTLGCRLAPFSGDEDAVRDVLVDQLQIGLSDSIREQSGATYGVQVDAVHATGGVHTLLVSTLVQNDKVLPALREIENRIRSVRDGATSPGAIAESKWRAAVETHAKNLSSADVMSTLVELQRDQRGLDSLAGYPSRLASVSAPDLARLVAPCVGHQVITARGPRADVEAPLKSLGIPVEIVDWRSEENEDVGVEDE